MIALASRKAACRVVSLMNYVQEAALTEGGGGEISTPQTFISSCRNFFKMCSVDRPFSCFRAMYFVRACLALSVSDPQLASTIMTYIT